MTFHVFTEPEVGFIAHTETSLEITNVAPLLSYQLDICLPSAMSLLDWVKQDGNKHKSPFQLAHSTTDTWWEYAEKRPALTQNYGKYMALITSGGPHDVSHVVNGFSWDQLGNAMVVDVSFLGLSCLVLY